MGSYRQAMSSGQGSRVWEVTIQGFGGSDEWAIKIGKLSLYVVRALLVGPRSLKQWL